VVLARHFRLRRPPRPSAAARRADVAGAPGLADAARLPGGSGDGCGDYVGGVPVERDPATVVADRGARVSVGGGFPGVAQRHASIQTRGGNEGTPECVRAEDLGDPGAAGDPGAPRRSSRRLSGITKLGPSRGSPMARSIARAVRGASGMVTTLPALRVMVRVRWPRSVPRASILSRLEVVSGRFGSPVGRAALELLPVAAVRVLGVLAGHPLGKFGVERVGEVGDVP